MILDRYIVRAHIGPFLFANAVIVFLFLLQFLMKSAGDIIGKGLSIWVIIELISLNLAWMLVLSVPMSVLVATLMAFGKLAGENEATILRAGGMSLYRMMLPIVIFSVVLAGGLVWFNNEVLPDANIRLRTLMSDILRIKPTLSLQAGVFTSEDQIPSYRILVRKTFEKSNELEGVTIYDLSRPEYNVVVTAERGEVSFSPDYTRLFMLLHDGEIHEMTAGDYKTYRRLRFQRHRISIPASGFGFQRSDAATAARDDRTMSATMMMERVDSIAVSLDRKTMGVKERLNTHVQSYLARNDTAIAPPRPTEPAAPRAIPSRGTLFHHRDTTGRFAAQNPPRLVVDSLTAWYRALATTRQVYSFLSGDVSVLQSDLHQRDMYLVEIYKKYSIPCACIVFVFIGAPLGMMARRGGFGVGAGLSLGFFLFYWACLIGGEKLADRGVLSPLVGMWEANFILGVLGLVLTIRTAREAPMIDWSSFARFIPSPLARLMGR